MEDKDFLARYDAGEKFSTDELQEIVLWGSRPKVKEIEGSDHRWQREMTTVFEVGGRLFALDWMKGLTEMQDNDFWEQPYEVREVTKMVEVKEYVKLEED